MRLLLFPSSDNAEFQGYQIPLKLVKAKREQIITMSQGIANEWQIDY
jgi:hypothetical protein